MKKEWFMGIGLIIIIFVALSVFLVMNPSSPKREVIIYTSVDQVFSEPVFKTFERETGIIVKPVYDVEAAKTTGLVNRLIAEKRNPTADLFWSGEFAQTLLLKEKGILSPYLPHNASGIPDTYKDPDGYWTGIGGRARTFLVNPDIVKPEEYPERLTDILNGSIPADRIGIANPLFGTTATHAAALYAYLGEKNASGFFSDIRDRGVRVVDGNSVVKDMVIRGELAYGLTDTDDACMALIENPRLILIIPDQKGGEMGTLVIPNTVSLINGGKHRKEAERLAEYLVSAETERGFIDNGWVQLSLNPGVHSASCINLSSVKGMNRTFSEIYDAFDYSKADLTTLFIR
jgi:iron(III) transport system substrate-binding protein